MLLGVPCVAVAIPGPGGRPEGAFSISGLAPYMSDERIRRVARLALEQARAGQLLTPNQLVPVYHRLSQAERERLEREQAAKRET